MEKVRFYCKTFDFFDIRQDFDNAPGSLVLNKDAIGGKTGNKAVLPRLCKIECGVGSSGAPPSFRGLVWIGCMRRASGTHAVAITLAH